MPLPCCQTGDNPTHIMCRTASPLNRRAGQPVNLQCCCGEQRFCKQCRHAQPYDTSNVFCSSNCSRAYDNGAMLNGHAAQLCPVRVDVTTFLDTFPRYAHGACSPKPEETPVPKFSKLTKQPRIETLDDGRVRYTIQQGYTEVSYTGEVYGGELDMTRGEGVFESTLTLKLGPVEREQRTVHRDPHFLSAGKHGKICQCECPECWNDETGNEFCNCAECPC